MKLIIDMDEDAYKEIKKIVADGNEMCFMQKLIANGIPLPKGHGRLIDENYLLDLLKCEEYETCTWRWCSECNRENCIKRQGY